MRRSDLNVKILVKAYEGGESAASLARRFDVNIWTVLDRLRGAGVRVRSRVEQNERRLSLSRVQAQELRALVDGLMLGDGHIDRKGSLRIDQAKVRRGWLTDIAERLTRVGASSRIIRLHARTRLLDNGREIRSTGGNLLYTPTYIELKAERRRWYPRGRKIVPEDVDLSPLALAYWLCGDGTYDKNGALSFCTNDFHKKEVEFLASRLTALGVEARCAPAYERPREFRVMITRRDAAQVLKTKIEHLMPKCCKYKLRFVRPTLSSEERRERRRRKLTLAQCRRIQEARARGASIPVLALRYDVSPPAIYNALRRNTEAHR